MCTVSVTLWIKPNRQLHSSSVDLPLDQGTQADGSLMRF